MNTHRTAMTFGARQIRRARRAHRKGDTKVVRSAVLLATAAALAVAVLLLAELIVALAELIISLVVAANRQRPPTGRVASPRRRHPSRARRNAAPRTARGGHRPATSRK